MGGGKWCDLATYSILSLSSSPGAYLKGYCNGVHVYVCVCVCVCVCVTSDFLDFLQDFLVFFFLVRQPPSLCVCVCVCVSVPHKRFLGNYCEVNIIKLGTTTASDMVMYHVLIILTLAFIQGHTDLNHENNKCLKQCYLSRVMD